MFFSSHSFSVIAIRLQLNELMMLSHLFNTGRDSTFPSWDTRGSILIQDFTRRSHVTLQEVSSGEGLE